jgi:hypothetical protein
MIDSASRLRGDYILLALSGLTYESVLSERSRRG